MKVPRDQCGKPAIGSVRDANLCVVCYTKLRYVEAEGARQAMAPTELSNEIESAFDA